MNILIVDDHALVRRGLKETLVEILGDKHPGMQMHEADRVQEAIALVRTRPWDLMILDLSLPDGSGLEALQTIKRQQPTLPILVLSMHPEDHFGVRALRIGASGYLTKDKTPEELSLAVKKVLAGGTYLSPELAEQLAMEVTQRRGVSGDARITGYARLSDREVEILQWIARGTRLTQIAAHLDLSVKTVSTYRARLLTKLGLRTTADLIRYAIDHRIT